MSALEHAGLTGARTGGLRVPRSHAEAVAVAEGYAAAIAPGAAARDRAGAVPWTELEQLGASGLLAIGVPAEFGGPSLGPSTIGEVIRVIAAADPAIAQVPQAHFLFAEVLSAGGGTQARRRLAAELLHGARFGNAVAERGGQHAQDLRVRLTRTPGGLRLNGRKYYCTGAISCDWIAVTALDDRERLTLAFVPRGADGVTATDDWSAVGQRSTVSGTVAFDDVAVEDALVIDYAALYEAPQTFGARAQLVHAAIEVGIAGGALADARWFLQQKARPSTEAVRHGAAAAVDDPHVIHRFGELATQVAAAEALLVAAGAVLETTPLRPGSPDAAARASLAVARAKTFGSEVAVRVASELFALTGASAADAKYGLDRHWRNARVHSVHDPVAWKYHHIGAYELSGALPPNHGQL